MWNKIENGLPMKEGEYLVYIIIYNMKVVRIQKFTLDAFSLDNYNFAEYKDCKKALFYEYDREYGYYDVTKYITYWMEIPKLSEEDI